MARVGSARLRSGRTLAAALRCRGLSDRGRPVRPGVADRFGSVTRFPGGCHGGWPILPPMEDSILRRIECADQQALERAWQHVADVSWVEACTVDLPSLTLEVRTVAPWRTCSAIEAQLERLEALARGR